MTRGEYLQLSQTKKLKWYSTKCNCGHTISYHKANSTHKWWDHCVENEVIGTGRCYYDREKGCKCLRFTSLESDICDIREENK